MVDLSTEYLGLKLKNPLVVSAGPLQKSLDTARRLEDAGAAAIVMHSLFEEQINRESYEVDEILTQGTERFAESIDYLPEPETFHFGPDEYIEHLRALKQSLGIPVLGSLNGVTPGGWVEYARHMEQAGADALELNMYYLPTDPTVPSQQIEDDYVAVLKEVKKHVKIPVAMKLGPFFSNIPFMCRRLAEEGADGLVLFNRFYQPDLDLEALDVVPSVSLSDSEDLRLPLRWLAIIYGKVNASLAATGGIHTGTDLLKALMVGADVGMMTAALLRYGPSQLARVRMEAQAWLEEHEYDSVAQMRGSMSHKAVTEPGKFERANYMKAINTFPVPEV